jgi:cephalosporin hydroxylase
MNSFVDRLRYGLRNWRLVRESVRLRTSGGPAAAPGTVDEFHRLFYETAYAGHNGWSHPRWMGVEALKCPFDLWIYQEILHELRPDVIVETGTARGGSALFLASVLDLLKSGQILSIDIVRRPEWPTHPRVTYLTGSSTSSAIVDDVRRRVAGAARVMVILDSDHKKDHVLEELRLYSPFVTKDSYLIVEDTNVNGRPVFPGFGPGPGEAVDDFLRTHPSFVRDASRERFFLTFNPGGYLKKIA